MIVSAEEIKRQLTGEKPIIEPTIRPCPMCSTTHRKNLVGDSAMNQKCWNKFIRESRRYRRDH